MTMKMDCRNWPAELCEPITPEMRELRRWQSGAETNQEQHSITYSHPTVCIVYRNNSYYREAMRCIFPKLMAAFEAQGLRARVICFPSKDKPEDIRAKLADLRCKLNDSMLVVDRTVLNALNLSANERVARQIKIGVVLDDFFFAETKKVIERQSQILQSQVFNFGDRPLDPASSEYMKTIGRGMSHFLSSALSTRQANYVVIVGGHLCDHNPFNAHYSAIIQRLFEHWSKTNELERRINPGNFGVPASRLTTISEFNAWHSAQKGAKGVAIDLIVEAALDVLQASALNAEAKTICLMNVIWGQAFIPGAIKRHVENILSQDFVHPARHVEGWCRDAGFSKKQILIWELMRSEKPLKRIERDLEAGQTVWVISDRHFLMNSESGPDMEDLRQRYRADAKGTRGGLIHLNLPLEECIANLRDYRLLADDGLMLDPQKLVSEPLDNVARSIIAVAEDWRSRQIFAEDIRRPSVDSYLASLVTGRLKSDQ